MPALNDLLSTVLERGARLIDWRGTERPTPEALASHCADLLSSKGEATGVALAARILEGYDGLDAEGRRAFFQTLASDYNPDPEAVMAAAEHYAAERSSKSLAALSAATETRRQELFRRLNLAPGGTRRLVSMRADLLEMLRDEPEFARIDADFRHLLGSWFNRGFLVLRPIDWNTPAAILEKITAYEAVHEIDSWEELRRRVDPEDRRCFAFFHPSMPDEPLVFVEVALTRAVPGSIQAVLAPERDRVAPSQARWPRIWPRPCRSWRPSSRSPRRRVSRAGWPMRPGATRTFRPPGPWCSPVPPPLTTTGATTRNAPPISRRFCFPWRRGISSMPSSPINMAANPATASRPTRSRGSILATAPHCSTSTGWGIHPGRG
jgi:hypothetical protein